MLRFALLAATVVAVASTGTASALVTPDECEDMRTVPELYGDEVRVCRVVAETVEYNLWAVPHYTGETVTLVLQLADSASASYVEPALAYCGGIGSDAYAACVANGLTMFDPVEVAHALVRAPVVTGDVCLGFGGPPRPCLTWRVEDGEIDCGASVRLGLAEAAHDCPHVALV